MMLLEALKKYVVIPNKREADKRLLSKWISEYDQRIKCRGLVGDGATDWYWVDDQDNALHYRGDYGWRAEITMRQLAQLCGIDYDAWMPPQKPVENTERLDKAIRNYEESKKKATSTPDPLANVITQIHFSFDRYTTHCVVKDKNGVVARSKAQAVGEDKARFDQLLGTNIALLKLVPKENWPEFIETLMDAVGVKYQIKLDADVKLVNSDEA